jgi:NAD(P)-dependent dehydrogenase (short-subunit alcohol dehydrogenase family)
MRDFEDKVAVVTGAASGIGRALANAFAGENMKVVLADVEGGALEEVAGEMREEGAEVLAVNTDVSKAEDVEELARRALHTFGAVHVVCNNAGVFTAGVSWEAPLEDYQWVLGVNVWGVIHGIRTFVPIMLKQETEGHIVNTASMAAVTNGPYSAPYYMSKHAVLSLSESIYHELKMRGAKIGVSALCPELVATNINKASRNRPESLQRKGMPPTESDSTEAALSSFIMKGTPPATIAQRVLQGIRDERFYILSEDGWRKSCETRLEDIRLGRNPTFDVPVLG